MKIFLTTNQTSLPVPLWLDFATLTTQAIFYICLPDHVLLVFQGTKPSAGTTGPAVAHNTCAPCASVRLSTLWEDGDF